ncbi:MAG: hypothetical protein ACHREM_13500 [Polyangiales bacterium]
MSSDVRAASFIPGITSASEANQKRHDLGMVVQSLQSDISSGGPGAGKVPSDFVSRWQTWAHDDFVPWFNKSQGFIGAGSDLDQGKQLQKQLRAFQVEASGYYKITSSLLPDPDAAAPGTIGAAAQSAATAVSDTAKSLKTLAWVLAIFGGAGVLWIAYKSHQAQAAARHKVLQFASEHPEVVRAALL